MHSDEEKVCDNVSSCSSEGEVRRSAAPATVNTNGTSSASREAHLSLLLTRASTAIRKERDRVKQLEEENAALRAQLASGGGVAASSSGSSNGPQLLLRQKLHGLALEHFVAVEEIRTLRARVAALEQLTSVQQVMLSPIKSPGGLGDLHHRHAKRVATPSPRKHEGSHTTNRGRTAHQTHIHSQSPSIPIAASATSPDSSSRRPSKRAPSATGIVTTSPSPAASRTFVPSADHHFDPVRSVQDVQKHHRSESSSNPPIRQPAAPVAAVSHVSQGVDALPAPYHDVMIQRLRRALAPPPSKEQLGEVVHAMVKEMKAQLKLRGTVLPLRRVEACVYAVESKHGSDGAKPVHQHQQGSGVKRLHMTVDSGRLVVKCGGGHVDLLEYLERNKICYKAPPQH